mgnify:CR=1 FL=1
MAFEEVSGKDLNWYFNQWYFGSGHPKLEISYAYNEATHTASAIVAQTQKGDKLFKLPMNIDVWNGDTKTRHMVWAENKVDTFNFTVPSKPDNINVDADKILLAEKKERGGKKKKKFTLTIKGRDDILKCMGKLGLPIK